MGHRIYADDIAEATGIDVERIDEGGLGTAYDVQDTDEILIRKGKDEDTVVVGYLSHDPDAEDYWGSRPMAGSLEIFRSEADRDEYTKAKKKEGLLSFVVDRYSHGDSHYSVQGTRPYPDRRWDVAPSGVYVFGDDQQDEYRKEIRKIKARPKGPERDAAEAALRLQYVEMANSTLDEYSKWCNGEVYGVVVETFSLSNETGELEPIEENACWGYIGHDAAKEVLAGEMNARAPLPDPRVEAAYAPA